MEMSRSLLGRLKSSYWKLRERLGSLISLQFGIMYERPTTKRADDTSVTELTEADTLQNMSRAEVAERLSNGHRLFVRRVNGDIAAYAWVASPGCTVNLLFDVCFPVPQRSIYIWDVFTCRDYRRKGYATELHHVASCLIRDVHSVYCAVDRKNKPSRAQVGKMGYTPVFSYFALGIVGRAILAYANVESGRMPLQRFLTEFNRTS